MLRQGSVLLAGLILLLLAVTGCGQTEVVVEVTRVVEEVVEVTVEVSVTQVVEVTRVVPEIMTVVVFPTAEPATATPEPTATLEASPTATAAPTSLPEPTSPPARSHMSGDVIAAFQAAGLEVGSTTVLSPNSDASLMPKTYAEGTRFIIPSLGSDRGGRVFSFATTADRDAVTSYYDTIAASGLTNWYSVNGLLVLQINGDLPSERWLEYEAVFQGLR